MPTTIDITVASGDSLTRDLPVAGVSSWAPGSSAVWAASVTYPPAEVLRKAVLLVDPDLARLVLEPEDSAELDDGTYRHELQVIDAMGAVETAVVGQFIVTRDYT
jgi:hypothetical protein